VSQDLGGTDAAAEQRATLGQIGQPGERGEVALHDERDVGSLDLHNDRLTRVEPGSVGLCDRGRRQWVPVEFAEHRRGGAAELGLQHRLDALGSLRPRSVLELGQLDADVEGQEVDSSGGDLTDLDVHAAGFLQDASKANPDRFGGAFRLAACS